MIVWNAHASSNSGNFRVVPLNRKGERGTPEHPEVVSVVGIFPDVFAGKDQISSCSLLQSHVELVTPSRTEGSDGIRRTDQKRIQYRVGTSGARKHQVLVEWGFQHSRIRSAKNRVGLLDVVGDADTRLGFAMRSEAVVNIATQSQIYGPVPPGNRILQEQREQFNVGVAAERK